MPTYICLRSTTKKLTVQAIQWDATAQTFKRLADELGLTQMHINPGSMGGDYFFILVNGQPMKCEKFDYVVKMADGKFYPCTPDIFLKNYKPAEPVS